MLEGFSAKQVVDLLISCKINPKQLFLLLFLYLDREEGNGKLIQDGPAIANVYRFAEKVETWTHEEIDDLVNKGLMEDRNTIKDGKRGGYPDYFVLTDTFIDKVFASRDRFQQFWDEYPSFVDNFHNPRGAKIPLKAADIDELEVVYNKRVRTVKKHKQVMEILDWAKKNGLINMNIAKYIGSMMYDQHIELRNAGTGVVLEHRTI